MVVQLGQAPAVHGWPRPGLNRDDKLGLRRVDSHSRDDKLNLRRLDHQAGPVIESLLADHAKHRGQIQRRCDDSRSSPRAPSSTASSTPGPSRKPFSFAQPALPVPQRFEFPFSSPSPRIKRRRHGLDVDGPNTAALSSKKRRLRGDLITSRLSQPYSQPATHILNREGMKSGDKRFLKMATSIELARRVVHLHATSFLRFSVMNRLRQRLGLDPPGMIGRVETSRGRSDMDTTSKAPWRTTPSAAPTPGMHEVPALSPSLPPSSAMPTPERRGSPPSAKTSPAGKPPAIRISKPAALPLPSADLSAAKDRTSTRIDTTHPTPEPRPPSDESDEDSFSFMHADDLSDEGEQEQVYSDFGDIFGGGGGGAEDAEKRRDDDHSYEEYLDELDGISWMTR
jgi:hypothetical protein